MRRQILILIILLTHVLVLIGQENTAPSKFPDYPKYFISQTKYSDLLAELETLELIWDSITYDPYAPRYFAAQRKNFNNSLNYYIPLLELQEAAKASSKHQPFFELSYPNQLLINLREQRFDSVMNVNFERYMKAEPFSAEQRQTSEAYHMFKLEKFMRRLEGDTALVNYRSKLSNCLFWTIRNDIRDGRITSHKEIFDLYQIDAFNFYELNSKEPFKTAPINFNTFLEDDVIAVGYKKYITDLYGFNSFCKKLYDLNTYKLEQFRLQLFDFWLSTFQGFKEQIWIEKSNNLKNWWQSLDNKPWIENEGDQLLIFGGRSDLLFGIDDPVFGVANLFVFSVDVLCRTLDIWERGDDLDEWFKKNNINVGGTEPLTVTVDDEGTLSINNNPVNLNTLFTKSEIDAFDQSVQYLRRQEVYDFANNMELNFISKIPKKHQESLDFLIRTVDFDALINNRLINTEWVNNKEELDKDIGYLYGIQGCVDATLNTIVDAIPTTQDVNEIIEFIENYEQNYEAAERTIRSIYEYWSETPNEVITTALIESYNQLSDEFYGSSDYEKGEVLCTVASNISILYWGAKAPNIFTKIIDGRFENIPSKNITRIFQKLDKDYVQINNDYRIKLNLPNKIDNHSMNKVPYSQKVMRNYTKAIKTNDFDHGFPPAMDAFSKYGTHFRSIAKHGGEVDIIILPTSRKGVSGEWSDGFIHWIYDKNFVDSETGLLDPGLSHRKFHKMKEHLDQMKTYNLLDE